MNGEKRTMKSWGHVLSNPDEPKTLEEAMLLALLTSSDRLLEVSVSLEDIKMRLLRIELWMQHNVPGYSSEDQRRYLSTVEPHEVSLRPLEGAPTNGAA